MEMLFSPVKIKHLEIKNRYVMAAMGNIGLSDSRGAFTREAVDYFAARAKGGTGLIITGICHVAPQTEKLTPTRIPMPMVDPAAFSYTATEMAERVHAWGSRIFMQLTAGFGYAGKPAVIGERVAPSPTGNRWQPDLQHRALTRAEIYDYIDAFAESAMMAKKCGFDGVEIHAVHEGYLLDQFTMDFYNHRQDEFGGSLTNRLRFATEIVKAIKSRCGEGFPVILRFSLKSFIKGPRQGAVPGEAFDEQGRDTEEGLLAAKILVEAGYDALDVDAGTYDSWYWNHPPMYFEKKGIYLEFARKVKEVVNVPVIAAGRMDDHNLAEHALRNNLCDMVALGRPLLADPDLPNKVLTNKTDSIRPCLSCHEGCMGRFARGGALSCAVNPACGRESAYGLQPTTHPKRIMVVGGGVAGMEVSRVAALRGHHVDLYEKEDNTGGVVIAGGMPPFKSDDHMLLQWYRQALTSSGVNVHCNTMITKKDILTEDPDIVIVATGATPVSPAPDGQRTIPLYSAEEVLKNTELAGNRVVIIGAGLVGAELGLWLKRKGKEITLIEASADILGGEGALPVMNHDMLKDLLNVEKVNIHTGSRVTRITGDKVAFTQNNETREIPADTVIYAIGYKSENALWNELADLSKEKYLLGDARRVKNIMYAIWDGYEIGRGL